MTSQLDSANSIADGPASPTYDEGSRLIDTWFPCPEVDVAVRTPAGSGLSEKALFTWFASRPIAQARAAVLCSLLSDSNENREDIKVAVLSGNVAAMGRLRQRIADQHGAKPPVVLDMFSGRGIIPLEAARAGVSAIGTDLSPVATLAGRLLADYPLQDWSAEPPIPYASAGEVGEEDGDVEASSRSNWKNKSYSAESPLEGLEAFGEPRLLTAVRAVLAEVGRRVSAEVAPLYPGNPARGGEIPWAYLWAVTIPCDGCGRRFPIIGSMALRHPYKRTGDKGQSLKIIFNGNSWLTEVHEGGPQQDPTYLAPPGKKGKTARCPFPQCKHPHSLDVIKAKGFANQYEDAMLAVAETDRDTKQKVFRTPRSDEIVAATRTTFESFARIGGMDAVPNEKIPAFNRDNVRGGGYGYLTYGSLMNLRQAVMFATTARIIGEIHFELNRLVSPAYAAALCSYAGANIARQLRRATRGSRKESRGKPDGSEQNRVYAGDVFTNQSTITHAFDYIEVGPGNGPGTWNSVADGLINALKKVLDETHPSGRPSRFRRASAIALPFRDQTVDVIVTDPPYYDMIAYADSSDLSYVWLKRALISAAPDLFAGNAEDADGLQDKTDEIIVKGRGAKGAGDHRSDEARYEKLLAQSFSEARRVLKPEGHLTVIFGHSDPGAWKRLLAALTDAGFVVTSSWPSRTETAATGVATISVTVSIGARVAPPNRPVGIAAQVDSAVIAEVKRRCRGWDADGLALEDQLMASYGAALRIVGLYSKIISPDGRTVPLEHYMTLARRAVRDAVALRLDEMPLETFDPRTRFAIFWHEVHGRIDVPKGEARFFAQSDALRLEDLRGPVLAETKAGFRLRHDTPSQLNPASSAYEVVRGMAAAWSAGTEAVAACLTAAERAPLDAHVWALVDWLATKLPTSDPVAVSLAAIKRNRGSIQASATTRTTANAAPTLFEEIL